MYKSLGKFGEVSLLGVRYQEDVEADKRYGYKLGFEFWLLPGLRFHNSNSSYRITLIWLFWSLSWNKQKMCHVEYDIQGQCTYIIHGLRYYISRLWKR